MLKGKLLGLASWCIIACFVILAAGLTAQASPVNSSGSVRNAGDYLSIQEAVNNLPSSGGMVFIPAGVYEITEPIVVSNSGVTLMGAGSGTVILNKNTSGGNAIELRGGLREYADVIELEPSAYLNSAKTKSIWRNKVSNMRIAGNEKSGNGIYAYKANELLLANLWVDHNGMSGLYLNNCTENSRISDSNIAYNKEAGIELYGGHDVIISANQFEENKDAIVTEDGFNMTITGNNIDDHTRYGIHFIYVRGSIITGNMIEECKGDALILDEKTVEGEPVIHKKSDGATVSGNIFRGCSKKAMRVSADGVTITGNTFEGIGDVAVGIEPGNENITISGNVFAGGPAGRVFGVVAYGESSGIAISGNTFVMTRHQAIAILGDNNRCINITGNTIVNPSRAKAGDFSAIELTNCVDCIISSNIIIDNQTTKTMKYGILEAGSSDRNIITGNRISGGISGQINLVGEQSLVTNNMTN